MYGRTERARILAPLSWASGQLLSRDIPLDTIIKFMVIVIQGSISYTFSSTPVPFEVSTFDNLVSQITVRQNGGTVIKSVRPWFLHMEQLLASGRVGTRRASAGSAASFKNFPTVDGGFVYGTTGQYTTVREAVRLQFEYPFGNKVGRASTYWNTKGLSSAQIQFQCSTVASLDKTTNATFANASFEIDMTLYETDRDVTPGGTQPEFAYYKQTTADYGITAQQDAFQIELPKGNWIMGLKVFCIQDSANASSTASQRSAPDNHGIKQLTVKRNGSLTLKQKLFYDAQDEMRQRFGLNAPFASNTSVIDGFLRVDFLENEDMQTALYAKRPEVDSLVLELQTNANDNTNNLYPLRVTVETEELVRLGPARA